MRNITLTKTALEQEIIEFRKVTTADLTEIKEAIRDYTGRMCDVSAGNLIFWSDYYNTYFYNGPQGFVIKFLTMDNTSCHVLPFNTKNKELITLLARQAHGKICISCLTDDGFYRRNFKVYKPNTQGTGTIISKCRGPDKPYRQAL